jgi:hypothetical protein
MWQSLGSVAQQDLQNAVIEILQQAGVDYMRAPYSATAQVCLCIFSASLSSHKTVAVGLYGTITA